MSNTKVHLLYFILFLILVSNIWLIKIRWENSILANDIENTRYEILKLKEINLNLTTEKNFLTSLSKTEMSSIQDLNMQNVETRLKIK
jgi:Cell division protein FtsL.